ncbi:MAG: DEAD/DEAH box helicase family protein, partial [Planctomycetes bacterium]|nr:DEAD/DEAH box helicase family protein [Planctomycetota bacterium]
MAEESANLFASEAAHAARVVLPTPVDQPFDYLIPPMLAERIVRGAQVSVPFGRRTLIGFVVEAPVTPEVAGHRMKEILEAPYATPVLDEGMLQLTKWIGEYYACSWGEACQAVVPSVIRRRKQRRTVNIARLAKPREEALAEARSMKERAKSANSPLLKQARVLEALGHFPDEDFRPSELAEKLGISVSSINTLKKSGWLEYEKLPLVDAISRPDPTLEQAPEHLTREQEEAVALIEPSIHKDEYQTFLLRGVTGSGKTEVYIQVLERVLQAGKSGIVLVPEISLTRQTVRRFTQRLGHLCEIAVLHSQMTDRERQDAWAKITSGEARIVIGPRSAIFAPVKDL